ncbi:hypothetical protein sce2731 [Sorangium cellulosum So ce56]|uniref:Right handed beta helix domain-containing protein n=2 Tax=Polyangiaceae TaxID=49 RepID=A9GAN8_SORC5|nr:hypothetical protein sce2731 [Sorangium cellulosum So ce56]
MMSNGFWTWFSAVFVGGAACATVAGCGSDELSPATCPEENQVRGVCVGVPAGDLCVGKSCPEGPKCNELLDVTSGDELTSAAQGASPGTCIALRSGRYDVVRVPGGVSLLGRSAAAVQVEGIVLAAGEGAVVRGLKVGREGVSVQGAKGVRIESVRVVGERGHGEHAGVELYSGSSVTIVDSEISDSGYIGVFAENANVTLERSVVSGAQRGGIVIEGIPEDDCDSSCTCANRPVLEVRSSIIRSNHIVGVALRGATASLDTVDVDDTKVGDAFETGYFGGGISAAECSSVSSARKVRVLDNDSFGILVDRSTAALGDEKEEDSIEISRNTRGLWIQNVCKGGGAGCVTLHNGKLDGNVGVGIGITGQSRSIILCRSAITQTARARLPVFDAINEDGIEELSVDYVGDGVDWLGGSEVILEELTLSGNARQSLLIDGPAAGRIEKLRFTGDADTAPVQQNFTDGDAQPAGMAPPTITERTFTIPQAPASP